MSHLGEKDFTNRLDYIQAQKNLIQKGLYGGLPAEDIIQKAKGEGARGGKVIGHTKSGKPIYESATHASHRNFTSGEHKEAIDLHESKIKTDKGNETTHYNQIDSHHNQLKAKKSKEDESDSAETKAFKHNHAAATKAQREHVAESYFGDKKKDLTSVGRHHHEQLSDALYEKMEADKKANKVEKAEGDNFDGTFDKAMTAEAGEGVTQKESVEHNPKDMQNAKPSDLKKAYEILGLGDLIEKAEGARGGKVIGHTKSGKPVYASTKDQADFHSFTKEDHKEASDLHAKEGEKIPIADRYKADRRTKTKKYDNHSRAASRHADFAKEGEKQVESESSHSRKNFPNFGKF